MAFSVDSRLKDLLADEQARQVLARHFAGRENDPRINEVLYYSLREIASYPEAGISREKLQAIDQDRNKLVLYTLAEWLLAIFTPEHLAGSPACIPLRRLERHSRQLLDVSVFKAILDQQA